MKIILIFIFTIFVLSEEQLKTKEVEQKTQQNIQNEPERQLKQEEKVENPVKQENISQPDNLKKTVKQKQKNPKQQERQLREEKKMINMRKLFLKDVDQMINKFGLDRELDEQKINNYFKQLEDKLFEDMKSKFLQNKEYTQMYDNLVEEYEQLKKTL